MIKKLRITIGEKSYEVTVEDLTDPKSQQSHAFQQAPQTMSAPISSDTGPATQEPQLPIAAGAVTSPMAGVVKSVLVKESDNVKEGQALVVLEAMKMENQITAPVAGAVKSVAVTQGESVAEGHVLLVLE